MARFERLVGGEACKAQQKGFSTAIGGGEIVKVIRLIDWVAS